MADARTNRPFEASAEHPYMPQRLGEDVLPYKGPAYMTHDLRVRRAIIGVTLFLLVAIASVIVVMLQGPIR